MIHAQTPPPPDRLPRKFARTSAQGETAPLGVAWIGPCVVPTRFHAALVPVVLSTLRGAGNAYHTQRSRRAGLEASSVGSGMADNRRGMSAIQ